MSHLTLEQRSIIEPYLKIKKSKDFIAEYINVDRSTLYRALKRNKTTTGKYAAKLAHEYACDRKNRFIINRKFDENCRRFIEKYLRKYWSLEQIIGHLYTFTRHRLKHRKRPIGKHYPIANRVSIEERPQVVDNRERWGDGYDYWSPSAKNNFNADRDE